MVSKTPKKRRLVLTTPFKKNKQHSLKKIIKKKSKINDNDDYGFDNNPINSDFILDSDENEMKNNDEIENNMKSKSKIKNKKKDRNIESNKEKYRDRICELESSSINEEDYIKNKDKSEYKTIKNKYSDLKIKSEVENYIPEYKKIIKKLKNIENELLNSIKIENMNLRRIRSDILIYKKLLGIEIEEIENGFICSQENVYKNIKKFIKFKLVDEDDCYSYKLLGSENINLPDYLCDEISFSKQQVQMFFFKIMEVMMVKNE